MMKNISEFLDSFDLLTSILTCFTFFSFFIFYYFISLISPEQSNQEINNYKDSDSRSACSEYSSQSEEKRRRIITKYFTKINKKMPEKILELKNKIINKIYGNKKEKNKFFKFMEFEMNEDVKLLDKVSHNKSNVTFNENEEFMIFD